MLAKVLRLAAGVSISASVNMRLTGSWGQPARQCQSLPFAFHAAHIGMDEQNTGEIGPRSQGAVDMIEEVFNKHAPPVPHRICVGRFTRR